MELFSIRNRVYTWTAMINLSIGIGFVAAAGVIWKYTDWGTVDNISRLAVGLLAVGLFAIVVAMITIWLGARKMRLNNEVASPEAGETTAAAPESVPAAAPAAQNEWRQMRIVEEVIEAWADKISSVADGAFDYEINKMDRYHYYVNFFNDKNIRVYQLLVAANKERTAFDVTISFIRPDSQVPQVNTSELEKQLSRHEHISLALA